MWVLGGAITNIVPQMQLKWQQSCCTHETSVPVPVHVSLIWHFPPTLKRSSSPA